jgi:hypothetical protein
MIKRVSPPGWDSQGADERRRGNVALDVIMHVALTIRAIRRGEVA